MNQLIANRRARHRRNQTRFPIGMLAALFTGSLVTLIGVFFNVDPFVVMIRTAISAAAMGILVSAGTAIVRIADSGRDEP